MEREKIILAIGVIREAIGKATIELSGMTRSGCRAGSKPGKPASREEIIREFIGEATQSFFYLSSRAQRSDLLQLTI